MPNTLNNFSPKTSFFLGILITIAIISTIGFIVLAVVTLRDNNTSKVAGESVIGAPSVQPTPSPSNPPSGSGDVKIAAVTDQDHIRGNKNAPISIIEFSDLECPFCKRFHPTMQQIIDEYDGQVNWVYRHFPLVSLHSKAPKEAEATECAAELGGNDGFWKYIDRLFEITPANNGLDLDELPKIAVSVGLNQKKFEECLDSGKYTTKVANDLSQAQAAGGRGTPYSVIIAGDQKIPVSGALPFSQLKSMIDPLLP